MAITNTTTTRLGRDRWRVTADDVAATYYWYVDGALVQSSASDSIEVTVAPGATLDVYVTDSDTDLPPRSHASGISLQWRGDADADYYRVDEYDTATSAWTELARVEGGTTALREYTSARLDDDTEHRLRVVPVSAAGVDGWPREYRFRVARLPDLERVRHSIADNTLTAAAVEGFTV